MLIHLEKNQNLLDLVKEGTVLVDFFATWCGPCKMLAPELEDYAEQYPNVTVIKIDVDEHQNEAAKFNIRSVPTLLVFKNGSLVKETAGYRDVDGLKDLVDNA